MAQSHLLRNLVIGGILIYAVRQYKLYDGLQFSAAGYSVTFNPVTLHLRIALTNPTGVSATLNSITGSIYTGGQYVAQVNYNAAQIISPYNRTIITLDVRPDLTGTLVSLFQYIANASIVLDFRGNAVVNSIPLPVTDTFSFGQTA